MRIATIAFACTLALAPAARAQDVPAPAPLALSPGGAGDALYLPYWAVGEDTSTLLSVSNTRAEAKAVRVTLVGADDAAPVFSFTLYLAPHDRYEAALVAAADGSASVELASDDASCTLPRVAVAADPAPGDPGPGNGPPGDAAPVASGAIEIVELGVLPGDVAALPAVADCAALAAAFEAGGSWADDANAGLAAPTGGLSASVEVVNEADATVAAFPATAFSGFSARARHVAPDAAAPRITEPFAASEDGTLGVDVGGTLQEFTEAEGAAAIAALLETGALHGPVPADATARSQWLLAVPGGSAEACIAASAQAFDGSGTEAGAVTPLSICGGTALLAVGEEPDGTPAALQFPASAGGSATLRFDATGGAPVIGYRLTSIGPELPEQASDRARDAVGPAWLVVQPLVREAAAPLPAPLPPPTEVPADG